MELIVALTLAAGVAVAVGQVVTQLTRGAASVDQRAQAQTETAIAMLRIRGDIEFASYISTLTSTLISFRHPDLTGDGSADTVTYQWSGTVGDPLTRAINGQAAESVLDRCRSFVVSAAAPAIRMEAGSRHDFRLEYYDNTGQASLQLLWSGPGGTGKTVIPTTRLFPAYTFPGSTPPTTTAGTGLLGEYYDNADFTNLKLTRLDASINFDWSTGSPASGIIGSDTFSVRWIGHLRPQTTNDFTFYTVSDDGVRLWLDNRLVIDNWTLHTSTEDKGATLGVTAVSFHLEAGPENRTSTLDTTVRLVNAPGYGG